MIDPSPHQSRGGIPQRSCCALIFCILIGCMALPGCVHRRMTITTNPPGALVMMEGEEVGYTPMAMDFTYYGTREITLIKDGFQTKTVMQKVKAPWYQRGPLEFATDNFALHKINDRHEFHFDLDPLAPTSNQDLRSRAEQLRTNSRTDTALPSPLK